jgi:cobalamin biosynthesis protein CbiG
MRSTRGMAHGAEDAARIARLTVVAIRGASHVICAVVGLGIRSLVRRELAARRFRRRLVRRGLDPRTADALTTAYRGMVPLTGFMHLRR